MVCGAFLLRCSYWQGSTPSEPHRVERTQAMCGIVGVAARRGWANRDGLITMRDTMSHRGPDNAGVWWSDDGRVGLAHRRLSIIDLSPAGRQPMADAGGNVWVTYNGEIYNYRELRSDLERMGHRFRTSSDTEVLLAAYRNWGL